MSIKSPKEHLGFDVGEDRHLADWPDILGYFTHLAKDSPRVRTAELGESTDNNPFILSIISSESNLSQLDRYLDIQSRLSDPRVVNSIGESDRLIADGKTVVLITCSIHATEIGGTQMSLALAHRLATANSQDIQEILDNVIVLIVPSMNPDGLQKIKAWYENTIGTQHEGVGPPFLYHKYGGHDNNRDWFMFNLVETRLVVKHCLNMWHPHIVVDVHQTRTDGMRMILPPFTDPIEPNVNPILESELAMLGSTIAAELTAQGKKGVATNVVYDAYSPSRAYSLLHGGVRLLIETASSRLASPINLNHTDLRSARGDDPTHRSWNHPLPWEGGRWGLPEIVDYDLTAVMTCLQHAARYRDSWLRNFYRVRSQFMGSPTSPSAFIIPKAQTDSSAMLDMVDILQTADVEIQEAKRGFVADGIQWEAGDRVVALNQPNSPFVKAVLESKRYPDIRVYPQGPLKPPYDVTAHSLPLLMGVKSTQIETPFEIEPTSSNEKDGVSKRRSKKAAFVLVGSSSNASVAAVNSLLAKGASLERLLHPVEAVGKIWPAGTYLVKSEELGNKSIDIKHNVDSGVLLLEPDIERFPLRAPRIGLYQSYIPNTEEGWTRLVLEQYGFKYESLTNDQVQNGVLADRFDTIILPHQPLRQIELGHGPGAYPQEYTGGLGIRGARALLDFTKEGGTVVAWDGAAEYLIQQFNLPITDVVRNVPSHAFYAPGSLLEIELVKQHPLTFGMSDTCSVMFVNSSVFEMPGGEIVGTYVAADPLADGLLVGPQWLRNKGALVVQEVGRGRVVLMGFRPTFRGQSRGTYRLLFNALYWSAVSL